MPGGRPTDYTPELASKICAELAKGKSVRTVCKADDMPNASSIYLWLSKHPEFSNQYAKAKEDSHAAMFEEMFDIADNASNDYMDANDPDNEGYRLNGEHINRSRLRVDIRKWALSKLAPKKYGDKIVNEHTGKVVNVIERTIVKPSDSDS